MKVIELAGERMEELLVATGLGIKAAAETPADAAGFFSAHSKERSVILFQWNTGERLTFEITGGSKKERREVIGVIRRDLCRPRGES